MSRFKVGDKVRLIGRPYTPYNGKIGKIQYYYNKFGNYRIIYDGKVDIFSDLEIEPAKKEFLIYRRKE
jgi:hypothetical protein